MPERVRKKAVVSLDEAQLDGVKVDQAAGEDIINHYDLSPELRRFLESESDFKRRLLDVQEVRWKEVKDEVKSLGTDFGIYRDGERSLRENRQRATDKSQMQLMETLKDQANELRLIRIVLVVFFIAGVVFGLLTIWLVYDRYSALTFMRLWAGAAGALSLNLFFRKLDL
jgi:hypothetical protein